MSTKGHWQRRESTPGAYARGLEAIDWTARDKEGRASTEREHHGGPSGFEAIDPQLVKGPARGAQVACLPVSSPASQHLLLHAVACTLEYQAHIGASAALFDDCKFEECQCALEDGCAALEQAKAALTTVELELSR